MPDVFLQKRLGSFRPMDEEGEALLRAIKENDVVRVRVSKARNPRHHRLFWKLMAVCFESQEQYGSLNAFVAAVKVATGHAEVYPLKDTHCADCGAMQTGNAIFLPKSISYASMSQGEFSEFYDKALDFIVAKVLPNVKRDELAAEIEAMLS